MAVTTAPVAMSIATMGAAVTSAISSTSNNSNSDTNDSNRKASIAVMTAVAVQGPAILKTGASRRNANAARTGIKRTSMGSVGNLRSVERRGRKRRRKTNWPCLKPVRRC